MINKFDIFEATVASSDPDIIGVTESWSTGDILDSELMLSGYEMFRCDRATNNIGGRRFAVCQKCSETGGVFDSDKIPGTCMV